MNALSKIEHEALVNMTSKGQVLIPKKMREKRGLTPNGKVRVLDWTDGSITLEPVVTQQGETRVNLYLPFLPSGAC